MELSWLAKAYQTRVPPSSSLLAAPLHIWKRGGHLYGGIADFTGKIPTKGSAFG